MSNYAMSAVAELAPVEPAIQPQAAPDASSLRAQFHAESQAARRMAARPGLYIAVIIYLLFAATDILLVPDVAAYTIAARFAVGATALVTLEALLRFGAATKWLDITCAGAIILGYIGWLLPTAASANHESVSYYMVFGTIFMMSANLFFTFQFSFSVVTSTIILLILYAVNYFVPSTLTYKLVFGAFYISCFVFTSYINWKLNRERYNVFLNALEARNQHREATERGKALLKLSRTDPLTGLENRRAVDERLRDLWSNWQRHGATFAVLLIDVDFFKRFNDYYGHQKGDRCLMEVAQAKNHEDVVTLAEEIRGEVEALAITHNERRDGTQVVTVSIGAAFTRDEAGTKLEKIIQEADRALYLAKADGRNCVHLFDPNDPQTSDESENVAALLKIAIERDLVSLVFQPIANMRSGRIEAMEALMRLTMPDGTAVPPSLFIPVAERTGMILELGRWAIRTACRELMSNEHIRTISVNVSPVQLKAPGFAASVAAALGEAGVTGDRLALEITEGLEMKMHSDVLRCISDLKLLGIKVWLDDFGTGFAGLSWLRLIDFDTVKIDRSFLHDCVTPRGRAMFRDIVGLLRNRGPKILVEGVESEEQLELLRKLDIDHAQGYHIGRPAPAERIRALFEEPKRQRMA